MAIAEEVIMDSMGVIAVEDHLLILMSKTIPLS